MVTQCVLLVATRTASQDYAALKAWFESIAPFKASKTSHGVGFRSHQRDQHEKTLRVLAHMQGFDN
jgi:hypothetical protein